MKIGLGWVREFLEAYRQLLFEPSKIVGKKMSAKEALAYYYHLITIPFILFFIVGMVFAGDISNNSIINSMKGVVFFIENLLLGTNFYYYKCAFVANGIWLVLMSDGFYLLFLYPLLAIIYSLVFHLVWKNFLQVIKGPYSATLAAALFGAALIALFVWTLPSPLFSKYALYGAILSFIILVWQLGVTAIAISVQHGISRPKAFGMMLLLGVLAFILPFFSAIFFSLGVFGGSVLLGTSCIAGPGYLCYGAYVSSPNVISATIGQSTGESWASANVLFVPSAASEPNPSALFANQTSTNIHNGLLSGQPAQVLLPFANPTASGPPGFSCTPSITGSIWVQYQTAQGGQFYYVRMATLYLR